MLINLFKRIDGQVVKGAWFKIWSSLVQILLPLQSGFNNDLGSHDRIVKIAN